MWGEEHRLQETPTLTVWLKAGGARKEAESTFARMGPSGEWCGGKACHGCKEVWGLSVGFCVLPSSVSWYHWRVSPADSGHALEVSAPPLLTQSGLAWQWKSHSGPSGWIQAGRTREKSPCFRVLEGAGVGCWGPGVGWGETLGLPCAVLSFLGSCLLLPPAMLSLAPGSPSLGVCGLIWRPAEGWAEMER